MVLGISVAALILSFLIPFVGLILGFVALREERAAGESGTLAIVAIVIGALGTIMLVVIVAIASIAAFGVFSPQRFSQERCVGDSTKFACTTNAIAVLPDGVVQLGLRNGVGESVTITSIETSRDCGVATLTPAAGETAREGEFILRRGSEVITDQQIHPNDVFVLEAHCQRPTGGVFDETFTVWYDVGGISGLRGTVEGVAKI